MWDCKGVNKWEKLLHWLLLLTAASPILWRRSEVMGKQAMSVSDWTWFMTLPSKLLPYLCVQVYMSSCLLRTWKSEKNGEQKSDRQLQLSIHKNCATASSSISPRYPQYCESLFISCSHHSTNALRAPYQKPESLKVTWQHKSWLSALRGLQLSYSNQNQ